MGAAGRNAGTGSSSVPVSVKENAIAKGPAMTDEELMREALTALKEVPHAYKCCTYDEEADVPVDDGRCDCHRVATRYNGLSWRMRNYLQERFHALLRIRTILISGSQPKGFYLHMYV